MRFTDGARLRQQWLCPGAVEIPTTLALNELIKLIELSSAQRPEAPRRYPLVKKKGISKNVWGNKLSEMSQHHSSTIADYVAIRGNPQNVTSISNVLQRCVLLRFYLPESLSKNI